MKLWADACVTPLLEGVAHARGYAATSNRQQDLLTVLDPNLYPAVVDGDWVFITNNAIDFRKLATEEELHPGLIVLPQGLRDQQCEWLDTVLAQIEEWAGVDGEDPGDWMVCRLVTYYEHDGSVDWEWVPDPPVA